MGLSSNIIWHFTNKEGFEGILNQQAVRYSYSLEKIRFNDKQIIFGIPMVCFIESPVSEWHNIPTTYGEYAIGFSRRWGVSKGGQSVQYYDIDSYHLENLCSNVKRILGTSKDKAILDNMYNQIVHTKNFEGELFTKKFNYKRYRFVDENEFRIVPHIHDMIVNDTLPLLFSKKEYMEHVPINENVHNLTFNIEDIRFLVVKSQEEQENIAKQYAQDGLRVITIKEIYEDVIGYHQSIVNKIKAERPTTMGISPKINNQIIQNFKELFK